MADPQVKIIMSLVDNASAKMKSITGATGKLDDAFKDLTGISLKAAAGIAGVGIALQKGIKFLNDSVKETIAYNKQIREMTQVTGLGAEEISRIVQVGDDWGVSIEALRTSLAFMNKSGISPSIDNLAALADEYVNTTDKTAFAEKAVKILGRGYQTLIPLLAQGGDSLREQAAAINDNLVATEDSIKQSREFEIAMDDLNDVVTGIKYSLANGLIPVVVDLIQVFNGSYDAAAHAADGLSDFDKAMGGLKAGIEGLHTAWTIARAGIIQLDAFMKGNSIPTFKEIQDVYKDTGTETKKITGYNGEFVYSLAYLDGTLGNTTQAQIIYNENVHDSKLAVSELRDMSEEEIETLNAVRDSTNLLTDATNTLTNEAIKGYADGLAEAIMMQAAFDLAMGNITQTEYDQIVAQAPLIKNLESLNGLLADHKITYEQYLQAVKDGKVTNDELIAFYVSLGLSAEEARLKILGLTDAINGLPERKQITIGVDIVTTGQMPPSVQEASQFRQDYAKGANFVVPPGYPNDTYPMNVESGERVIVIPKGGNTNNTTNFSMTVHTNAPYSTLLRDYNTMKAMVG